MSFSDFTQLLADPNGRSHLNGLLGTWYGYKVAGQGEAATVGSSAGERIDPIALHARIQGNPKNQHTLYQLAMALWR